MSSTAETLNIAKKDWIDAARELGPSLAAAAARHDCEGSFVADNYALLKQHKLFSASIPESLGGGGASHADVCAIVRELGKHCGSTALSYAMHSHPVMANIFKHRRGDDKASAALTKIAAGELVIAGTGANDWLASNGEAIETQDGFIVNAHKRFVSGGPGADLFVTSAIFDGDEGPEVLHFAIPMNSKGIEIQSNWDTLGMRGTGSNDILMKDVFVPAAAIAARRPVGEWHPMWDVIVPIALPIIVSCYVGMAGKATELAINSACGKTHLAATIGKMQNELTVATLALDDMIRLVDNLAFKPDMSITDAILTRKAIAAGAVKSVVELASEIVGGPGFFRAHPMERIVRDIRALHFHPLPERIQRNFSGRLALGLEPIEQL
jgi:acyl-CoA dehydrogenase